MGGGPTFPRLYVVVGGSVTCTAALDGGVEAVAEGLL
jgi:hypothetical protein